MNKITKTVATLALTLSIFAFPVLADCGEMPNGNKCLVQDPTDTTVTKSEKREFDIDKEITDFLRDIYSKIFG